MLIFTWAKYGLIGKFNLKNLVEHSIHGNVIRIEVEDRSWHVVGKMTVENERFYVRIKRLQTVSTDRSLTQTQLLVCQVQGN